MVDTSRLMEKTAMTDDNPTIGAAPDTPALTRRSAFAALGTGIALTEFAAFAPRANAQTRKAEKMMSKDQAGSNKDATNALVRGGGLLVVAQWEVREGQADAVADILNRYLPQAQASPDVKLFLIARAKENPAQFLFYELFADEAAYAAHQASAYFQDLIAGQALKLLSKRERTQYTLL